MGTPKGCEEWDNFVDPAPFTPDDTPSAYETAMPSGQDIGNLEGTDDEAAELCVACHAVITPAEVARYHDSQHAALPEPVTCVDCHGRTGHGEYLAFGYSFKSETLGIDGETTIGSGREHTYWEWKPKMIVTAMQAC
jgi:hypothetical protein